MNRLPQTTQETSKKLKAKQYAIAGLIQILLLALMIFAGWRWGYIIFGSGRDEISLWFILYCVRGFVLLFCAIDFISAVYHFLLWNRAGRPWSEDDNDSLLSDWKDGSRCPIKISLTMLGCMAVILIAAVAIWS